MKRDFLCIGGALIDRKYVLHAPARPATSNPGAMRVSFGGVARNISETLVKLGCTVALAAAIGDDAAGDALAVALGNAGVDTRRIIRMAGKATPEYAAILDHQTHELVIAVVAMDQAEACMEQEVLAIAAKVDAQTIVFADANLSAGAMVDVIGRRKANGFLLAVDAVSIPKSKRLPADLAGVDLVFMNADEAGHYLDRTAAPNDLALGLVAHGAKAAVVTDGAAGAWCASESHVFHQAAFSAKVADVTGAGDSLIATTLWRIGEGDRLEQALGYGVLAASLTTESVESVHPMLSPGFLETNHWRIGKT
jgi:pseudouridine kinase